VARQFPDPAIQAPLAGGPVLPRMMMAFRLHSASPSLSLSAVRST
jgi:hypothetical protein